MVSGKPASVLTSGGVAGADCAGSEGGGEKVDDVEIDIGIGDGVDVRCRWVSRRDFGFGRGR
jgi:hypothetical protein